MSDTMPDPGETGRALRGVHGETVHVVDIEDFLISFEHGNSYDSYRVSEKDYNRLQKLTEESGGKIIGSG